jgi:lysophospholipid acyltransferase (LPLAT)-like uncharacterized protein
MLKKIFGKHGYFRWAVFKTNARKLAYTKFSQNLICNITSSYLWLVYLTSKRKFINHKVMLDFAKNKQPLIVVFWHNRLMMIPFFTKKTKRLFPNYNFMTLSSKHGDGRFVGKVMEKFGFTSIVGSTRDEKHKSRGISISSLKQIIKNLKSGEALGITPDGPRGPNQRINGEILNIAKISGAKILPCSYSSSNMKQLNSWDKFKIPLPFGKLCFFVDEQAIEVPRDSSDEEIKNLTLQVENRLNLVQENSLKNL